MELNWLNFFNIAILKKSMYYFDDYAILLFHFTHSCIAFCLKCQLISVDLTMHKNAGQKGR